MSLPIPSELWSSYPYGRVTVTGPRGEILKPLSGTSSGECTLSSAPSPTRDLVGLSVSVLDPGKDPA